MGSGTGGTIGGTTTLGPGKAGFGVLGVGSCRSGIEGIGALLARIASRRARACSMKSLNFFARVSSS